jgi:hypothetical protein
MFLKRLYDFIKISSYHNHKNIVFSQILFRGKEIRLNTKGFSKSQNLLSTKWWLISHDHMTMAAGLFTNKILVIFS